MTRCALYRVFNDQGGLIYVGISGNPVQRIATHETQSDWFHESARVEIEWFHSREGATEAEITAIRTETPRYNISRRQERPYAKAAAALNGWMDAQGANAFDVAGATGIRPYIIMQAASGKRPPNKIDADSIEALTSGAVPASSWTAPEAIAAE